MSNNKKKKNTVTAPEPKRFGTWVKLHLGMAAVFGLFGLIYQIGDPSPIAVFMLILAVHALISAYMYYVYPQYASNTSGMTAFLKNIRSVFLIGFTEFYFLPMIEKGISTYIMIAVTAALILFVYFTIKYFLLFREELKRDANKKK
ncbi:MAG: hypothetical protein IKG15_08255 [Solobacterium sp.]|nr:hypothetical protein [Solobacterium sp.]